MEGQSGKEQSGSGDESTLLERVARLLSNVRGARPAYARLAMELEHALPFDLFGIVLLHHDRGAVRVTTCRKEGENWVAHYHQLPLIGSMAERMLHLLNLAEQPSLAAHEQIDNGMRNGMAEDTEELFREELLVASFSEGLNDLPAECGDALYEYPWLRSILVAPLLAGGQMLGTLELGSADLSAYHDPGLQRLVRAIARVLATAIEGAQVGGNVEIQDRQRAELKNVSEVLTSEVDLPRILERIVSGITNALHVAAAIVRYDGGHHRLYLEVQSQLDEALLRKVLWRKEELSEQGIIGSTLLSRQRRFSSDIAQDANFPASRVFADAMGVHSIYCHPLITGQYIYGALLLLASEPGGFTPLKADIFALFAAQATVAVHNGLLLQAVQERRRFQEAIEQFERDHRQNVFSERGEKYELELLERLRQETMQTFGVDLGSILHFISDHLLTRSERHLQDILRSSRSVAMEQEKREVDALAAHRQEIEYGEKAFFLARVSDLEQLEATMAGEGTAYLMQAADEALAWTGFLRDISAALLRVWHVDETQPQAYERLKHNLADPLFIVDLEGKCLYCNRAAEIFCGLAEDLEGTPAWGYWPAQEGTPALFSTFRPQAAALSLEDMLAPLFPRVRRLRMVLAYLRAFVALPECEVGLEEEGEQFPTFLRCTIAAEPLPGQMRLATQDDGRGQGWVTVGVPEARAIITSPGPRLSRSAPHLLLDNAPSDRHYQLARYALYNDEGQWFASTLHIRDVTEQVRDEKNKAVLLAAVSHDLRTPLTTIKAAASSLLQPEVVWDEEVRREMLADIDAEADHLTTLVEALVEMSRIEMGALVLEKEWCDLAELVHDTLIRTRHLLEEFYVRTHIQSPLPLIYADYTQLGRALSHLLENAARHSPRHAQIRIVVDTPEEESLPSDLPVRTARMVRVQVVDEGPGVPQEEQERIFQSFYHAEAQGSGLGLAICRGIIEAHQGKIWVQAHEKDGANFVFVLPVAS